MLGVTSVIHLTFGTIALPSSNPNAPASSSDTRADENEIGVLPRHSTISTQSPFHFVLGNFFVTVLLISLIIIIITFL